MNPTPTPVNQVFCNVCQDHYPASAKHLQSAKHLENIFKTNEPIVSVETAVKCRLQTYFLKNPDSSEMDYSSVLEQLEQPIVQKWRETIDSFKTIKTNMLVYAYYVKFEDEEVSQRKLASFKTANISLNQSSKLTKRLSKLFDVLIEESENFEMKDSGWTLEKILGVELRINRHYQLCRGEGYVKLPFRTSFVVNVQNDDEECFRYAVLGRHLPDGTRNKHDPKKYRNLTGIYDFSCIDFPVQLDDIGKFEKANRDKDVSINVYGIRPKEGTDKGAKKKKLCPQKQQQQEYIVYPLRLTKQNKSQHTNLLYFESEAGVRHYCWITSLENLVRGQLSYKKKACFLCDRCLTHFFTKKPLERHQAICRRITKDGGFVPEYPEYPEEPYLYFRNHQKEIRHQCVVYADFESYLRKLEEQEGSEKPSFAYQRHDALSVAYTVVSSHPRLKTHEPVLYRQNDANVLFLNDMIGLAKRASRLNNNMRSRVIMSDADRIAYERATNCAHCKVNFNEAIKVKDHDHQYVEPGKSNYRKALCSKCNLKYVHPKKVVVYFHNSSRYDLHHIVRALAGKKHRVEIIPNTEENYVSLSVKIERCTYSVLFVDSYRFLPNSLDDLVAQLPDSAFFKTKEFAVTPELFELCKRKAILPYDYIENEERLANTEPPPITAFYNRLTDRNATDEEYARFLEMWNEFGCRNLADYIDKYLTLDVCLLADVFEENRRCFMETHKLDPANYLTLPSFGFDSFLKLTGIKIELFTDHEMTLFVMQGIYGGITQCGTRYAKANNHLIPETYEPELPSTFIHFVDATGLYANAMCQPLPYAGYKWLTQEELDNLDVTTMPDDGEDGVILEVSLEYPEHLHDMHWDFPFCPRSQIPPAEGSKTAKLLTTLEDKNNYVIHFAALKQVLKHGLVLKEIHRGIVFKQKPFLKEFIELNARLRKEAKDNKFKQSLMKLISNSCFGKFLENPLKRKEIKLATNAAYILKLISRIDFLDRTIFDEELAAIHLRRTRVKFDRPMIVGLSILALSKIIMYKYFYEHIIPKYGRENVKLLYMDTDSFILLITTCDIYGDMRQELHMYDTSNYSPTHYLYSKERHKQLGTFTDETCGIPISEYVGVASKVYAYKTAAGKLGMKAKGVQECVKNKFNFDTYLRVLHGGGPHIVNVRQIVSKKHILYSQQTRKTALTGLDDKRVIQADGINTLPYGYRGLARAGNPPPSRKRPQAAGTVAGEPPSKMSNLSTTAPTTSGGMMQTEMEPIAHCSTDPRFM